MMRRSTSMYVAASLVVALAMAAGASADQLYPVYAEKPKDYDKETNEGCYTIIRSYWNDTTWRVPPISLEHAENQECERRWWTSIAGREGRTVANYIGQSFADGAPLLMQSGNVSTCFTSLDYDYDFGLNVKSACWPAEYGEMEPEGNHVVRVTLELPLQCGDGTNFDVGAQPVQTILVQADVALCGDDAGEDRRSIREVADNQ